MLSVPQPWDLSVRRPGLANENTELLGKLEIQVNNELFFIPLFNTKKIICLKLKFNWGFHCFVWQPYTPPAVLPSFPSPPLTQAHLNYCSPLESSAAASTLALPGPFSTPVTSLLGQQTSLILPPKTLPRGCKLKTHKHVWWWWWCFPSEHFTIKTGFLASLFLKCEAMAALSPDFHLCLYHREPRTPLPFRKALVCTSPGSRGPHSFP